MFSISVFTFCLIFISPNDGSKATLRSTSFYFRRGRSTKNRLKTNITLGLVFGKQTSLESLPSTIKTYKSCTAKEYRDRLCGGNGFQRMPRRDTCVLFVDSPSKVSTWRNARTKCRNLGADLVKIPDKGFEDDLDSLAPRDETRWIGIHTNKNRIFKWLDEDTKARYTNWSPGNPDNYAGNQNCVTKGYYKPGLWDDDECSKIYRFICQRASGREPQNDPSKNKPTLQVDALEVQGRSRVHVDCTAFIYPGGDIRLGYKTSHGERRIKKLDDPTISIVEDGAYLVKDKRCSRRYRSTLNLLAVAEMHRGAVLCCSVTTFNQWKCAQSPLLTVNFLPQAPELHVEKPLTGSAIYVGNTLSARCTALVGTDGSLLWTMSFSNETYEWLNKVSGTSRQFTPHTLTAMEIDWKQYANVTVDPMFGPHFWSVIRVTVAPRMCNLSLTCAVGDDPKLIKRSRTFNAKFPPKQPRLQVFYHEAPDLVIDHKTLQATCSSFVGTGGSLVWSLERGNLPWVQKTWSVAVSGDVGGDLTEDVSVGATPATADDENGPLLKSAMSIQSSYRLVNATLSCHTPIPNDYRAQNNIKATELRVRSLPFQIIFLPKPPLLSVKYKNLKEQGQAFLQASCTAFVGTGGVLRWVLDTLGKPVVWALNVHGEWTLPQGYEAGIANVSRTTVTFDIRNGPRISSNLQIVLTSAVENVDLYCLSYNSTAVLNFSETGDALRKSHTISSHVYLERLSSSYPAGLSLSFAAAAALFFMVLAIPIYQECRSVPGGLWAEAGKSESEEQEYTGVSREYTAVSARTTSRTHVSNVLSPSYVSPSTDTKSQLTGTASSVDSWGISATTTGTGSGISSYVDSSIT